VLIFGGSCGVADSEEGEYGKGDVERGANDVEQHSITTKPHGNDTFSVRGCKPSLSLTSAFPPNLAAPIASAQHAT
jgi:hypothetical protein